MELQNKMQRSLYHLQLSAVKESEVTQTLFDPMEPTRLLHPCGFSKPEYWNGLP